MAVRFQLCEVPQLRGTTVCTEVKSARRLIAFCFQSEIEKTGTDILWPFTHRL